MSFKNKYSFEHRKAESTRIRQKYPDRIPIICEKDIRSNISSNTNELTKIKYLVPFDLTVGNFVGVIRKRINLEPEKAMFLFINNVLPPNSAMMSTIYHEHKDADGFIYFLYSEESTFG